MYVDGVSIEPLYIDDPLVEAEKQVQSFICSKRSKRIGRRLVRRGRHASTVKNPTSILNLTYEPSFTLSLNVSATFSLCKFTIFSTIITEIRDIVKICLVACRIFPRLVFPDTERSTSQINHFRIETKSKRKVKSRTKKRNDRFSSTTGAVVLRSLRTFTFVQCIFLVLYICISILRLRRYSAIPSTSSSFDRAFHDSLTTYLSLNR